MPTKILVEIPVGTKIVKCPKEQVLEFVKAKSLLVLILPGSDRVKVWGTVVVKCFRPDLL